MNFDPHRPLEDVIRPLADSYVEIIELLSEALVLVRAPYLRDQIAAAEGLGPDTPIAFARRRPAVWLVPGPSGETELTVLREPPSERAVLDLDGIVGSPAMASAYATAIKVTESRQAAEALLAPLFGRDVLIKRADFKRLVGWSPLIEHACYKSAVRCSMIVEALRQRLLHCMSQDATPPPAELDRYWRCIHAMGHLILMASMGKGSWLSEMVHSLEFKWWTPSLWLNSERTSWLSAIAARCAAAFGEAAIELYLTHLSSTTQPIIAFDALFGLAALGLGNPSERIAIRQEILKIRKVHLPTIREHASQFELIYANAIWLLSGVGSEGVPTDAYSRLDWKRDSARGLATRAAFLTDPTEISSSGEYVGFAMLPFAMRRDPSEHYPNFLESVPSMQKVAKLFSRAWSPNGPNVPRTLH